MQDRNNSELVADDMEALAVAQALYKSLGAELETAGKGGTGMRARADAALMDAYEKTGADRLTVKVDGTKVGTMSVTTGTVVDIVEPEALDEWLLDNGLATEVKTVNWDYLTKEQARRLMALAGVMNPYAVVTEVRRSKDWSKKLEPCRDGEAVWKPTGELVPGVKVTQVAKGTTLKVDENKVLPMLPRLGGTVRALIGAQEEVS